MERVIDMTDDQIIELIKGKRFDELAFQYDWSGINVVLDATNGLIIAVVPESQTIVGLIQYV